MNTIKFAGLISLLTGLFNRNNIKDYEIVDIADKVQEIIEAETIDKPIVDLKPMFQAMIDGKKIEAIKEYRTITGEGLKESKDAVESVMSAFQLNKYPVAWRVSDNATGWILFTNEHEAAKEADANGAIMEELYNKS